MAKKIDAYVDTSTFIAFLDRADPYHYSPVLELQAEVKK